MYIKDIKDNHKNEDMDMTTMYKIQDKYVATVIKGAEFTGRAVGTLAKYVVLLVALLVSLAVMLVAWVAVPTLICAVMVGFNIDEPATTPGLMVMLAVFAVWAAISVKVYFRLKGV